MLYRTLPRLAALAALLVAVALTSTDANAISAFKGRYSKQPSDCVFVDASGQERLVREGETTPAQPGSEVANRNVCSCPKAEYRAVLLRPAKLFCVDEALLVQRPANCDCQPKPGTGNAPECRICVHDKRGGKGCSGWTPQSGGSSSWSRWIHHEGGVAATQYKRFRLECR